MFEIWDAGASVPVEFLLGDITGNRCPCTTIRPLVRLPAVIAGNVQLTIGAWMIIHTRPTSVRTNVPGMKLTQCCVLPPQ